MTTTNDYEARVGTVPGMSGATAPLWVTIMLAVLTVVGTVGGAWGGQWIAARRDDRRWEREATREDLRWQRESDRQSVQRDHEARLHWRDERLKTYSSALAAIDTWLAAVKDLLDAVAKADVYYHKGPERDAVDAAQHDLREQLLSIELIGSPRVRQQVIHVLGVCKDLRHETDMVMIKVRDNDETNNAVIERTRALNAKAHVEVAGARADLLGCMRSEFAIDTAPDLDFGLDLQRSLF